ncbi:hypothetical protein [Methylophaga sp. OBS3]|uniref:hypothetical protein n=1 Tax=Methylophaga sp. OBS3 TaxID=2991934 RepID=UPI0022510E5E|nr:hypothetical protein [Methylophaga sp. OBS3]MCX4189119.1 hypothetical protein [Methylophaga sp. OBS3]
MEVKYAMQRVYPALADNHLQDTFAVVNNDGNGIKTFEGDTSEVFLCGETINRIKRLV